MQQQLQHEQYGNNPQHQVAQPMMLCPIQYVYETPTQMLMPQSPDDQIPQSQTVLFNVQNPPPWIQNRPQNQVVYVQQVPNNYQHFIHPNMIQSTIYHPQLNYQIQQQMLPQQDNRQYVQIPNLTHFNTVQNQPAQAVVQAVQQQVNNEDPNEKMPLLTQMLSQKAANNNVRAQNVTNIRATNPPNVINNNMTRPVTQNQQVQTEITANNKGRPRMTQPQVITINPMQQRHFVQNPNQKQDVVFNVARPASSYMRAEVPQHIRSKIPSSISVKTIYRPILPRPMIRPFDVMPGPQNFYYGQNVVAVPSNPEIRNTITSLDNSYQQQNKVQFQPTDRNLKPSEVNVTFKNIPITNNQENTRKQTVDANVTANSKIDQATSSNDRTTNQNQSNQNMVGGNESGRNTENETQTEEKLIRNTVYVQARGRVLNEKEVIPSQSPKRTIDDRNREERLANNQEVPTPSNKHVKLEVTDSSSQTNNNQPITSGSNVPVIAQNVGQNCFQYTPVNTTSVKTEVQNTYSFASSSVANHSSDSNAQQSRLNNLLMNTSNMKSQIMNAPKVDEIMNVILTFDNYKPVTQTVIEDASSNNHKKEENIAAVKNNPEDKEPINHQLEKSNNKISESENIQLEVKKTTAEEPTFSENNNKSLSNMNMKSKGPKHNREKITVLTHVLDGYIIQESNVAFPIQKPLERENKRDNARPKRSKRARRNQETEAPEDKHPEVTVQIPGLKSNVETERETDTTVLNKGDPFANILKPTVQSWTTAELVAHLAKHEWRETAAKLQEEEIDGESILLVNKEQLVAIGVSETHADIITAFAGAS